jgi:glycosyltransferase involved in cell wall biosynthesis
VTPREDVVVGVCTFRRPVQLSRLLSALAAQQGRPAGSLLRVVVVDNAPGGEGREVALAATGIEVTYVLLGVGNISVARNEVLARTRGSRFVAMLDDDEWPEPTWLQALLERQEATGADLVVGPVRPVFPPGTAPWLVATGGFGVADVAALAAAQEGITGNVLLAAEPVHRAGLRFDAQLGLSGGEDQLFFRQARLQGLRLDYAPSAVVYEDVPADRLRAGYVLRGEYRRGNTLGLLDRGGHGWPQGRPARRALVALWWAATGALRLLRAAAARDRTAAVLSVGRTTRAAGMVVGLLGRRFDLYARAGSAPPAAPTKDS